MKKTIAICIAAAFSLCAPAQRVMTLAQCIDYAVSHNVNVKRYANNVEQQKVQLSTARNSRLPDLTAGASQSFNFGRGLNSENAYVNRNTQSTGFNLQTSVPLLTGGRIPNEIAMSRLNLQAATADLEHARQSIALQVAAAYLQAVYAAEVVKVQEAQVAFSKIQEDRISKLFNAGKSPESDVVEAHSQVAQDEMGRTQAKCDYKLAMLDLSQLLELSSPDSIEIVAPQGETSPTLPPLPDRIFARAEGVKPEIQAEKLRLQAAEKNIRIAKAALYPTLSLGAGLSSEYYKTSGYQAASFSKQLSDNFNKSIGLSLNIPIFNRLATRNSIRQAKLQQSEQALQLDETKKTLYKEIQQAYYNAVNAQAKYESALAARKAAESNFNMMTGKFENGRANATELEEAKTKRANAITSTLQAKYEYILRMKIIEFYEGNKLG
ncbi:MAG: hypothetical protein DBY24_07900 [Prevotellaceae bacterium]|nr:MAG: hypothetical protein DBY24_07900 [Prevotellaceae bacterium]